MTGTLLAIGVFLLLAVGVIVVPLALGLAVNRYPRFAQFGRDHIQGIYFVHMISMAAIAISAFFSASPLRWLMVTIGGLGVLLSLAQAVLHQKTPPSSS